MIKLTNKINILAIALLIVGNICHANPQPMNIGNMPDNINMQNNVNIPNEQNIPNNINQMANIGNGLMQQFSQMAASGAVSTGQLQSMLEMIPPQILRDTVVPMAVNNYVKPGSFNMHGSVSLIDETRKQLNEMVLNNYDNTAKIIPIDKEPITNTTIIDIKYNITAKIDNNRIKNITNRFIKIGDKLNQKKIESAISNINFIQGLAAYVTTKNTPNGIIIIINVKPGLEHYYMYYFFNYGNQYTGKYANGLLMNENNIDEHGLRILGALTRTDQTYLDNFITIKTPIGKYSDQLEFNVEHSQFQIGKELEFLNLKSKTDIYTLKYWYLAEANNKNMVIIVPGLKYKKLNSTMQEVIDIDYTSSLNELFTDFYWLHRFDNKNAFMLRNVLTYGFLKSESNFAEMLDRAEQVNNHYIRFNTRINYQYVFDKHNKLTFTFANQMASNNLHVVDSFTGLGVNGCRGFDQYDVTLTTGMLFRLDYTYKFNKNWSIGFFLDRAQGRKAKTSQTEYMILQNYGLMLDYNSPKFYARLEYAKPIYPLDSDLKTHKISDHQLWITLGYTFN